MIQRFFFIFLLALPACIWAQQDPWSIWDTAVIQTLHTARDIDYLNEEEKKVILFMNMARHDGPLFSATFLEIYLKEKSLEKNTYTRSLKKDLKRVSGLAPLVPEKDLTAVAQSHATDSGKKGTTGHQNFKKRFESLMGNPYTHVGENCSYGYYEAIDIVLSLLIDEGVKDLGHRTNILSPDFTSIGLAIRPHKRYRVNCVMDFGSATISTTNAARN